MLTEDFQRNTLEPFGITVTPCERDGHDYSFELEVDVLNQGESRSRTVRQVRKVLCRKCGDIISVYG